MTVMAAQMQSLYPNAGISNTSCFGSSGLETAGDWMDQTKRGYLRFVDVFEKPFKYLHFVRKGQKPCSSSVLPSFAFDANKSL